jgi:hypothetical protein
MANPWFGRDVAASSLLATLRAAVVQANGGHCPLMAAAFKAAENKTSSLVAIWKPPATMARAPPRVSPVSVIVMVAVPVAPPPVVSTIEVLVAVAAGDEVAVKNATLLVMEETEPKK